ncbi:hypothetical protein G7062_10460 [Erysipelothrix sp. HDW6C]|uniref:hypothetical protein n=1 Tax=Erysipelothrix sp. HDW6C TaxID=2714930 RepID=UPI00140AE711|nr:hypothetical protein [Erysipelothrix sp. HDW6C]QIK70699.1 hypothetical protein G7062_10460 [Erysipelothrix sp. HDW6C]
MKVTNAQTEQVNISLNRSEMIQMLQDQIGIRHDEVVISEDGKYNVYRENDTYYPIIHTVYIRTMTEEEVITHQKTIRILDFIREVDAE